MDGLSGGQTKVYTNNEGDANPAKVLGEFDGNANYGILGLG